MKTFYNPVRSFIGQGSLSVLDSLLANRRYVVISSAGYHKRSWGDYFPRALRVCDCVSELPSPNLINDLKSEFRNCSFDLLIAVGGGAVLDVAKSIRALWSYTGSDWSNLSSKAYAPPSFDLIAIPTTCGSGAEATPFAALWDHSAKRKISLSSEHMFPSIAIADPALTISLPRPQLISSALDALSHALESLWNRNATPMTRSLAETAIKKVAKALPEAIRNPDLGHREELCWASHMAGYVISQTKTALGHSMSYPVTMEFDLPHGIASSMFLPQICELNYDRDTLGLFRSAVDTEFGGRNALLKLILDLFKEVHFYDYVRKVTELNQTRLFELVPRMYDPQRADNNIVQINQEDIRSVLAAFCKKLTEMEV